LSQHSVHLSRHISKTSTYSTVFSHLSSLIIPGWLSMVWSCRAPCSQTAASSTMPRLHSLSRLSVACYPCLEEGLWPCGPWGIRGETLADLLSSTFIPPIAFVTAGVLNRSVLSILHLFLSSLFPTLVVKHIVTTVHIDRHFQLTSWSMATFLFGPSKYPYLHPRIPLVQLSSAVFTCFDLLCLFFSHSLLPKKKPCRHNL
jgi:hypothetical protein